MQRLQAFKFELRSNSEQMRQMVRFAGSCRFVFNKALALQKANHEAGGKYIGYVEMAKQLTTWRNGAETPWLKDAPVHPLQQTLKDLERAYTNFFDKRAAFPKFKKKGQSDSFRYPDPKQIKLDQGNSRIFLPKLGWLRYRNSRDVLGEVKNATIRQRGGKWFVSIQIQKEVPTPITTAVGAIGIDVGIARFASFSNSDFIAPLNSFKRHEQRLARYQRCMSRKQKGSKNHHKAKRRVQKIHTKIANARLDFLHKATTTISKNHAMVVVEDLKVKNMSQSAAGTKDAHGKNVRAKSGLNKAILDQGWSEFRRQLEYKMAWQGGIFIAVPPQHTSQTCPECGHIAKENRVSQAQFKCVNCGFEGHADVVGAINILSRGMQMMRDEGQDTAHACAAGNRAQIACGEAVRRAKVARPKRAASTKQEPTEATMREVSHA